MIAEMIGGEKHEFGLALSIKMLVQQDVGALVKMPLHLKFGHSQS